MNDTPIFRRDLYRGTAKYYDEFRLPYPRALIDDLCRRIAPAGNGRLLDVACGPGTVTFALADRFAEVVAVDQEPETIAFAEEKAKKRGVHNVEWIAARAEDIDPDARFDVVTIGSAFHRLDRRRVAALAVQWLRDGGYLANLWATMPMSDEHAEPWQVALREFTVEWMNRVHDASPVPENLATHLEQLSTTDVLRAAGFGIVGTFEFIEIHDWTIPELIGVLYSTSILSRPALGDHAGAFERDLEERMLAIDASGTYREHVSFAYDLACVTATTL